TNFFGRSCEVENLHRFLNPGGTTREGVVIWGLSGYGKTQLAVHYIDNYWPSHLPVIWIDASSRESIEGAFDDVATELQTSDTRCKASIHDVMRWLCQDTNKSWLLVFDSVDICEGLDVRKYFPNCEHGSIIITTIRSDIHSPLKFHGIGLEGVGDLAGSQILLGYLARVLPDEFRDQSTKAISRKLKGIPLAIEQAGAFLSLGTVEIHYYLEHFKQKYEGDTYNTLPLQYGYSYEKRCTIYAALDMVHEVLQAQNPDSVKLLNLSVFLGPGEIEFSTLADAPLPEEYCDFESNRASSSGDAERLPNIPSWLSRLRNQARDFGTAMQKLEQVSLIKSNRQDSRIMSYVVHEMVRGWIQGKLSDEETSECAATAFALTGMVLYDESGLCSTPTIRRYTARLNAILRVSSSSIPKETVKIPEGKYASLYGSVASGFGKFCRIQGQLERAKELLTTALEY
ncbi:P-loop containing nucleoside triphosphate hydrolase protein, partial [Fusarium oxysporum]